MNHEVVIEYWVSSRWREKRQFRAWISATGQQLDGFSDFYNGCTLSIDDAELDQLDLIGEILDVPRVKIPQDTFFFGYQETYNVGGYGQAPYIDRDNIQTKPLPDELYRVALKAKAIYNTTDCTRASFIRATKALTGADDIELIDSEDMSFSVKIHDNINDLILYILNLYKAYIKPAGVKFAGYKRKQRK